MATGWRAARRITSVRQRGDACLRAARISGHVRASPRVDEGATIHDARRRRSAKALFMPIQARFQGWKT